MALSGESWLDRRILRRKLGFWRVIAILAALAAGVMGFAVANGGFGSPMKDHIARVRIEGTISEDEKLLALLKDVAQAETVKGVIVTIDSPGGTTAGGEAVYEAVRALAAKKPVSAQVGTLAASAGYMIATATDHIVARKSSIVGSIGVLFQYPDVSELLAKAGVKVESIKSSPLKAEPNFFTPASEEAKSMIRSMIMDSYDWFVGIVDERRPLDRLQTLALADGSVFTGRQALQNKLIDELGGEDQAKAWLETKGVAKDLEIVEWKPQSDVSPWWMSASIRAAILRFAGFDAAGSLFVNDILSEHVLERGLVSVWHVDSSQNPRN